MGTPCRPAGDPGPRGTAMRRFMAGLLLGLLALLLTPRAWAGDQASVDAYLRQVARRVDQPGVYVDPSVLGTGALTARQVDTIRAQALLQDADLHILVVPAARLTLDQGGFGPAHLAYRPAALVAALHRLVGKPGTYAVLTSASTRGGGQSLYAAQWAGNGVVFKTGAAAHDAIACCAPDYGSMLLRFVARSSVPRAPGHRTHLPRSIDGEAGSLDGGGVGNVGTVFVVLALMGVVGIGSMVVRGFRSQGGGPSGPSGPPATVDDLRGPLGEEIEQVRQQISAADTSTTTPDPAAEQIAAARSALDQAHTRMTTMSQPADAAAVASALADARYHVTAAVAVRAGRPAPERTLPCFVDPRHGPSVTTRLYPPSGLTSPVPVCAACDAALAAGSQPAARSFQWRGSLMYPWMPYGPAWWYLSGYWGGQPFLQQLAHHDAFAAGNFDHHHGAGGGPDSGGGGGFGGHHGLGGFGGEHHGGGGFGGGGFGGGGGHGGGGGFGGGGHGGGGGGGGGHHG